MNKLRAVDDIQLYDWVMDETDGMVYQYDGGARPRRYLRILMPGDVMPKGAVLVRWHPGRGLHMDEMVATYDWTVDKVGIYLYALKSLPERRVVPDDVREEYTELHEALDRMDTAVDHIQAACDSVLVGASFHAAISRSYHSVNDTSLKISKHVDSLVAKWPELKENA